MRSPWLKVYDDPEYFLKGPKDSIEVGPWKRGDLRGNMKAAIGFALDSPNLAPISSIGDGRCELTASLVNDDCVDAVAVEPSLAVEQLLDRTMKKFGFEHRPRVFNGSFLDYMLSGPNSRNFIFCESIEHIHPDEFRKAWTLLVGHLKDGGGRVSITNFPDFHPITPDGTYHLQLVDDKFYDRLAEDARETVFRQGSHLVLDF